MDELEFYDGAWTGQEIDAGIGLTGTLANALAIVVDGNKSAVSATVGQYVIVKNSTITSVTDGLYTAAQAIPANTAIDATYLTSISNGGLNSVGGLHYDTIYQTDTEVQSGAVLTLTADISQYRMLSVVLYYSSTGGANRGTLLVPTAPNGTNILSHISFAAGQHLGVMRFQVHDTAFAVNSAHILQANGTFTNTTPVIIARIYGIK